MVNRLSNYLSSQKIAKLHLRSAQEYLKRNELQKGLGALTAAFEYMITANNNLASIAFNHRPKEKSR